MGVNSFRVLNIISSTSGGGAEVLVRELHKLYLDKDVDSHVVYFNSDSILISHNEQCIGLNPRNPLNIFFVRKLLKKHLLESHNRLIVHVHLTWPLYYVFFAKIGLKGIPLIYTEHSTNNKRRKVALLRVLERKIYSGYVKVICISSGVFDSLVSWLGGAHKSALTIIYNGARLFQFCSRSSITGCKPKLISVGSLTAAKNFSTTIRAVAVIREEIESYVIVGEGPCRKQLEQLIADNNLCEYVSLEGWSDDVEKYLQRADIQLIPSLWEGFGLVAVEGMSTGLPIVASDVVGLNEVVDDKRPSVTLVSQIESVEEWVGCIRIAIKGIEKVGPEKIALSARKNAEKFSMDIMAEKYLALYGKVASEYTESYLS